MAGSWLTATALPVCPACQRRRRRPVTPNPVPRQGCRSAVPAEPARLGLGRPQRTPAGSAAFRTARAFCNLFRCILTVFSLN